MHAMIFDSITSIHPSVRPSVRLSVHPTIHPSIHPSMHAFIYPSVRPSVCPSVRPSHHPSIHPCMHPYYVVHVYMSTCQTLKKLSHANKPNKAGNLPCFFSPFPLPFVPSSLVFFLRLFVCGESTPSPFLRVRRFQVFFLSLWRASWWRHGGICELTDPSIEALHCWSPKQKNMSPVFCGQENPSLNWEGLWGFWWCFWLFLRKNNNPPWS